MMAGDERGERAVLWAIRLSEGTLLPDEQTDLQAWLDADARNGEMLEEVAGAWQAVEDYAAAMPMMTLREEALASARRAGKQTARTFPEPRQVWMMVAATVLLVFAGLGTWFAAAPQAYRTGIDERRVVVLADGSKLSLDAATTVKVKYSDGQRRLWLERGRAKFDVAKDPLRPFSVAARDKLVVATGTAFSVELVGAQFRVVLYEGNVAVLKETADGGHMPVVYPRIRAPADRLLTVGRELVLTERKPKDPAPRVQFLTPSDPVRSTSWEAGMLVFENETLDVVTARINRYSGTPLSLGNPAVARLRISGVFRAGETEALLEGLAETLGVRAESGATGITLFKDEERS